MLGSRFGVDMHVATTDVAAARNLMLAVERCHLDVEAMVASPYVAGLAVLADDEADLGSAVVDMGAGTTTMAAFLRRPAAFIWKVLRSAAITSPWISPAASMPASPTPSESRRFMAVCSPVDRMSATWLRCRR